MAGASAQASRSWLYTSTLSQHVADWYMLSPPPATLQGWRIQSNWKGTK